MNDQVSWQEKMLWYEHLKSTLKKVVKQAYEGRWEYSLLADKGLSIEIGEREGVFEIQEVVYDEVQEELIIYAKVDQVITTAREIHEVVHQLLSDSDEGYFIFIPSHTEGTLQYWFMTGFYSHGHIGRIILRQEDNPHLRFDTELDML